MDNNSGSEGADFADSRTLEEPPSRFCRSGREATPPLMPLIALSVLSFGFWAAVLVAVASSALVRLW